MYFMLWEGLGGCDAAGFTVTQHDLDLQKTREQMSEDVVSVAAVR